ncbi:N-acetylglucosaminyl-phosphatidylinositol de-N-acetylase-like isoform X1 [Sycon ciliatum]|uniref:N-acetylglucosaminyl-phosphatidylinositol de-N-acetylase-like isoform X1 n=1 Tax=Sycon ciliatum TaxID=27933 RepID=UPI0031F6358E
MGCEMLQLEVSPNVVAVGASLLVCAILTGRFWRLYSQDAAVFSSNDLVLFVVAHPDDECMFFGPTVISAVRDAGARSVHLLCLSTGNYYGQGAQRRTELVASCSQLGIPVDNVSILDSPELQDGADWSAQAVAQHLKTPLANHRFTKLVTFDAHGVSGHTNHVSAYHGVRWLEESGDLPAQLEVFSLESVNLVAKYTGLLTCFLAEHPESIIITSDVSGWVKSVRAMLRHGSQLLWFRYLFVAFSRYMWRNTLTRLQPTHHEAG